MLGNVNLRCVQSIYHRSDSRERWGLMPHAAYDESARGETLFLSKPVFGTSSTAAWWALILPSCKSCVVTLLPQQLSCCSSLLGRKPLCSAEPYCKRLCMEAPQHTSLSSFNHRQLVPSQVVSVKHEAQQGGAARKSLLNVVSVLQWLFAGVGF